MRKVPNDCSLCKRRRNNPLTTSFDGKPAKRLIASSCTFFLQKLVWIILGQLWSRTCVSKQRYGYLFACLVTRAVHLEVAESLEKDSFINELRRFIAKRGPPSDIYSDNGTYFVEADWELKQSLEDWNQSKISDCLSQKDIQWHFNPPASPHFGGIWECLVQSCKNSLKVVIVTDEVL